MAADSRQVFAAASCCAVGGEGVGVAISTYLALGTYLLPAHGGAGGAWLQGKADAPPVAPIAC